MQKNYPRRLAEIEPFKVMDLLARARKLEAQGHRVIHMEVGEPDFDTPDRIVNAGIKALQSGETRYTPAGGLPALRESIARYYNDNCHTIVAPERIFVTAGASGALLLAMMMTMDKGKAMLMTDPGYPCYRHMLTSLHASARLVPVSAETQYQLTTQLVQDQYTDDCHGVLLASPANPTGALVAEAEMVGIADFLAQRAGFLLVDEIYQGLVYGRTFPPTAVNMGQHVFVTNSFSKYFGMTGWRLGWLVVPDSAIELTEKLSQNLYICASSIAQVAALEAFNPASIAQMEANKVEFHQRRDYLVPALRELGFQIPLVPAGAFYVYARLPDRAPDSEVFCHQLLEQQYVAVTPGTDFGHFQADRFVRFSYAQSMDRLKEGVARIARALSDKS
ncbi:MAG: aminotransferase class I/II-fold pyridoxal phosphate-dependent enzyme [Gammaproteobacteria bacterium]|nr:aminotransferase class I/II-fold pyridoxal phosphate-dependent enzyme [Gammaproteobacteria bacterium]